jgi:glutamate formiminotransferase/formiminotetrahydrofolate cyclodeaminase
MNVRINAAGFNDKVFLEDILGRAAKIEKDAITLEAEIIALVNKAISA